MSVDYFLYSPSRKVGVMVGSVGLSGTRAWPLDDEAVRFIKWAIDENVKDIVFVDEHRLAVLDPDDEASAPPLDSSSNTTKPPQS